MPRIDYEYTTEVLEYYQARQGCKAAFMEDSLKCNLKPASLTFEQYAEESSNQVSLQGHTYTEQELASKYQAVLWTRADIQAAYNCMTNGIKNYNSEKERVRKQHGLL